MREALTEAVQVFCFLRKNLEGWKTHILVLLAINVIVVNHFVQLPEWMVGDMKPENWLKDIWLMTIGSTIRAAVAKRAP